VYEEIRERIAVQLDQANHLDSKAGNLLAFSSIVLTVAAGLRFAFDEVDASRIVFIVFLSVGALLYVITMFFAFRAYAVVTYRRDPEPRPLRDNYLFEDPEFTKRRLISNLIESFEFNADILRAKAYEVRMASRYLFLETFALATALALERVLT
jgi:hypothetical protein